MLEDEKPEIDDFNNYVRDVIIISGEFVSEINRWYEYVYLKNSNSYLIFGNQELYEKYFKIKLYNGHHYALGISLGYHKKAVSWWCKNNKLKNYNELATAPIIKYGSITFKAPYELIGYIIKDLIKSGVRSIMIEKSFYEK